MAYIQRAIWTFLVYALVGPFFGGLAIAIIVGLGPALGFGSLFPDGAPPLGLAAVDAFVWSIVPALISGIVLAVVSARYGTFSWFAAAIAAIVAFTIAALILPAIPEASRPYLAFLAGLVGIAVRQVLASTPILPD